VRRPGGRRAHSSHIHFGAGTERHRNNSRSCGHVGLPASNPGIAGCLRTIETVGVDPETFHEDPLTDTNTVVEGSDQHRSCPRQIGGIERDDVGRPASVEDAHDFVR
jgi:hypothetical protein